jgi:hypothetical protein
MKAGIQGSVSSNWQDPGVLAAFVRGKLRSRSLGWDHRIRPSGNCVGWRERLQPHHGSGSQLLPSLARYTSWG